MGICVFGGIYGYGYRMVVRGVWSVQECVPEAETCEETNKQHHEEKKKKKRGRILKNDRATEQKPLKHSISHS